jgi:ribose-phosphate pyrophosphokinase
LRDIKDKNYSDLMIVSPDMGGVMRARAFAKGLGTEMAIVDKRRPKANEAEVMNIIGDINGKNCIIVDDMIDTAKTLCKAAEALKNRGAKQVYAYATHAIFSGDAVERIDNSIIDEVIVTDTIPLPRMGRKIRVCSIAELVAETIRRINNEESISLLLND